ncbi:MAG: S-layer homology domain-containing protein [Rubrobacteridae bacterium]|nr:S-layer homology domain-containing protein [Rubrobacteridae bacterium]
MVATNALKVLIFFAVVTTILIAGQAAYAFTQSFVPITFPVAGNCSFEDTFGAPRGNGTRAHEGIDIIADKMTPAVAVVDGTIDWLNDGVETSTANGLPYFNLMLHGDDGNDYFYLHLNNDTPGTDDGMGGPINAYAPGIVDNVHVKAGQTIAFIGDSGNAEETVSHLHFEIHVGGYKINLINPYISLIVAKNGSPFKDVLSGDWCVWYVLNLSSKGIIGGYSDNTFRPTEEVTKGEFIKMVSAAVGIGSASAYGNAFGDVSQSHWAWPYIEGAKAASVVDGDANGLFHPDEPINRAEAAKIAVKAFGVAENISGNGFSDVPQQTWAFASIMTARSAGIIEGYSDGTFRPHASISRAEAAKIIYKICK